MLNGNGMQREKLEDTVPTMTQGLTGAVGMLDAMPGIQASARGAAEVPVLHVLVCLGVGGLCAADRVVVATDDA